MLNKRVIAGGLPALGVLVILFFAAEPGVHPRGAVSMHFAGQEMSRVTTLEKQAPPQPLPARTGKADLPRRETSGPRVIEARLLPLSPPQSKPLQNKEPAAAGFPLSPPPSALPSETDALEEATKPPVAVTELLAEASPPAGGELELRGGTFSSGGSSGEDETDPDPGGHRTDVPQSEIDGRTVRSAVAATVLNAVASKARPSQLLGENGGGSLLGATMDGFWGLGQQSAMNWIVDGKAPRSSDLKNGAVQILAAAANQQVASLIDGATQYGQDNDIPFLRNLELKAQWFAGERPSLEARTIDSLFQSTALDHTLFLEGAVRTDFSDTTTNIGLGYRYQKPGSDWMFGANAFLDSAFPIGHQRMSLGVEASTSDFTLFANRYIALTDWIEKNNSTEERALSGWDVGIAGQMPHLEDLRVSLTAFRWEQETERDKIGLKLMGDYAFSPALLAGGTFAADDTGNVEAGLRLTYQFGADNFGGWDTAFERDRRLGFVNRENVIVTEQREIPKDYIVAFQAGAVDASNQTALSFDLTNAPLQSHYSYRITSSGGGGTITGEGLVSADPMAISGIDVSGLPDGTLTLTLQVVSKDGAAGPPVSTQIPKSVTALTVTTATAAPSPTNVSPIPFAVTFSQAVTGFDVSDLVLTNGTAANFRSDDGKLWTVDVTPLAQGTVSLQVPAAVASAGEKPNEASNTTNVEFDNLPPANYSVAFLASPTTATEFEIRGGEIGAAFSFRIVSSNGGAPVEGNGTIGSDPQRVTGLDLSGLADGTLTLTVTLRDALQNIGTEAQTTLVKTPAVHIVSISPPDPGEYDDL